MHSTSPRPWPRLRRGVALRLTVAIFVGFGAVAGPWSAPRAIAATAFSDVSGHPLATHIAWLVSAGITSGCTPTTFCPDAPVTREQMATFLVRATDPLPTSVDYFTDDETSTHELSINRLAAAGMTSGCGPGRFCPKANVRRGEMATFLVRTFGLPTTDGDYFVDDQISSHEANINRLAAAGVGSGCAAARFCPSATITRAEMAAFLHRAMGSRITPPPELGPTAWGLMGGYSAAQLADMGTRGVSVVMMTVDWTKAEPADGAFDAAYFARKRTELAEYEAAGFDVVLSYGLEHAPAWLLAKPNSRYVSQSGAVYTRSDEANFVFATELRTYAERYTARVFMELGGEFIAVRIGGGHWGELTYPQIRRTDGSVENNYWAYGTAAARTRPTGSWKPGDPSPNGEARQFLDWYLQSLTSFQNWQIAMVRRSFAGTIAPLYASWGMREGDFDKAVATNLNGSSAPERNGEVQGGFDHARHINAITDNNVAAWGTYGERPGTVSWLAGLAAARGFQVMAENSGHDTVAHMDDAILEARRFGASLFMWVRAETAYCRCDGFATIDDYEARITSP